MAEEQKIIARPHSFTVLIDTHEKYPWSFTSSAILGTKYVHLKTGDYTVENLEDKLCIERKRTANELAQNVQDERFFRELDRMQQFPYRYILLESTLQKIVDYPHSEDLSPAILKRIQMRGAYLLKCINRMQVKYGVNIIYCGNSDNAQWVATNLMKEVVDIEFNRSQ